MRMTQVWPCIKPDIELGDFVKDAQALGLKGAVKTDSQPGVASLVEFDLPAASGTLVMDPSWGQTGGWEYGF